MLDLFHVCCLSVTWLGGYLAGWLVTIDTFYIRDYAKKTGERDGEVGVSYVESGMSVAHESSEKSGTSEE